jgi:RNA polymerase sigma-70 factor, ECF subfamily
VTTVATVRLLVGEGSGRGWGTPVQDEQQLLAQVATGDEEALHQLYLAYRPRLYRYLWHQLDGDSHSVEEALQDVFLAVWRSAGRYRAEARVSTWIYQICHHVALDARRRLAKHTDNVRYEFRDNAEEDPPDWPNAASMACDDSVLDRLALGDAFDRLSLKHREVLALVFQQGFSPDEAAEIMGVATGTIRSRISYARKALWRELYTTTPAKEMRHDAS